MKKILVFTALSLVFLVTLLPVACAGEETTVTETKTLETTIAITETKTVETTTAITETNTLETTKTVEIPGPTKTVTQTVTSPPTTNPPTTNPTSTEPPSVEELSALGYAYPEMPRITAEQLKQLMDDGWVVPDDFVLVDTQSSDRGYHIWWCRTYISISWSSGIPILSNTVLWQLRNLPKDKLVVFYDHGRTDESAASTAQILLDLNEGYDPENIKVLWQGFDRWRELKDVYGITGYSYYDPAKAGCS